MAGAGRREAVVVGGSMAGLFTGIGLLKAGWGVDVYERAGDPLTARGAGIAGHAELSALLAAAGVEPDRLAGIDVAGRVAYDRTGRRLTTFHHAQYLTPWSLVFQALKDAFPAARYHAGVEVVGLDTRAERPVATFSDGSIVACDLVVGADGFRSKVRAIVAPEIRPSYCGYVAFRGLTHERDLSPEFKAETFRNFAFVFPGDGQFIGYPLLGPDNSRRAGDLRYGYLWYRPVPSGVALDDLLTDADGRTHAFSIAPPLIRTAHLAAIRRHAQSTLPPVFREVVCRAYAHMLQPIYDVLSNKVGFGSVALVGDAAFVARPHVGIGVLKAAQDAEALVGCLQQASDVAEGVAAFDRARVPVGRAAVRFAAHLGSFIEHGDAYPWDRGSASLSADDILRSSARPLSHLRDASPDPERLQWAS